MRVRVRQTFFQDEETNQRAYNVETDLRICGQNLFFLDFLENVFVEQIFRRWTRLEKTIEKPSFLSQFQGLACLFLVLLFVLVFVLGGTSRSSAARARGQSVILLEVTVTPDRVGARSVEVVDTWLTELLERHLGA